MYKVGDEVIIGCAGEIYSSDNGLANKMGAFNFQNGRGQLSGHVKNGMIGIIDNIMGEFFLVNLEDGYSYLFNIKAFKLPSIKKEIKIYGIVKFMKIKY